MRVLRIKDDPKSEKLIRTLLLETIADSFIENEINKLQRKFAQLCQLLADDNSLSDENIRRICNFAGPDESIEIIDRKDLDTRK